MRPRLKITLAIIVVLGIGSLLIWAFVEGRKEAAMERERERPVKAPPRVSTEKGESIVTLDRATQKMSGIEVASVKAVFYQQEFRGYGTVMELQPLVDLRNSVAAAHAQLEKARARLEASHEEYERVKALQENRNISVKVFQSAEAAWRSDDASARAADTALSAIERTVRQRWGGVLAEWLFNDSKEFERLMQRQDMLVRITLPPGSALSATPRNVRVQSPEGNLTLASLVSPAPSTDPRIQGMSLFYIAPAQATGLFPGMNVLAYLPSGSTTTGIIVPRAAVVRWQGKMWIYVKKDSDRFVRREISAEAPVKQGWVVTQDLFPNDRVVTTGAQLLLSEELRSQIHLGE
jgi:hypothetical protein